MKHKWSLFIFLIGCINFIPIAMNICNGYCYLLPINVVGLIICWFLAYKSYKKEKGGDKK